MSAPDLSIVVPVFDEEANLPELRRRLTAVLDAREETAETVLVDDGSSDGSLDAMIAWAAEDPRVVVVEFNRNYGQHAAVFAGLARSRGEVVVTIDADLQNPPEEIPRLLDKVAEGHDVVGGVRRRRKDPWTRRLLSRLLNRFMGWAVRIPCRDYGCMLRAYRREVVEHIGACPEISSFVPALANAFAKRIAEVEVEHAKRSGGRSKYGFLKLLALQYDLLTGFSLLPIRLLTLFGAFVSLLGLGFGVFLMIRRIVVGPEVEGVFTLFAVLFFFVGAQFLAFGLLGEYIGRIYAEVRRRPRYVVRRVHGGEESAG